MPPKSIPQPAKEALEKEQDVLQAVVLADSYNHHFQPLTQQRPRCLLPLCNVPLLEWTLESLAIAGVKEVIVFCTTKAEMVKEALKKSTFSRPSSPLTITTVVSPSALSTGDALRELDSMNIIKSDFILLSGDVVSNIDLKNAVEAHKERRKVSKDSIMTIVVKEGLGRRIRPIPSSSLFVLSPKESNQLLHYEPVPAVPRKKRAHIPGSVFDLKYGEEEVEVRNDLIDCGIDVCSVDIPGLFTENFDYQSIRVDFLPGILTSDLLNLSLHVHFAGKGYATRVSDTRSYDAVSRDVLARWTWPLVPDGNLPGVEGEERYEFRKGGVYVTKSTVLSRTCTIGPNTLIGSRSQISSSCSISTSIIGHNVQIHPSCVIKDSYIWDNAIIGEGSVVEGSIIGHGVVLGKGTKVGTGCLIGEGVKIGEGAKLESFTKVGRRAWREDGSDDEDDEDEDEGEDDDGLSNDARAAILGPNSKGFIWPSDDVSAFSDSEESDIEDPYEYHPNKRLLSLGRRLSDLCLSDSSGTISVLSRESTPASSPTSSTSDLPSVPNLTLVMEVGDEPQFRLECLATLDHAFEKGGAVDDESLDFAALQIKSARATTNVGPGIVREVVLFYLLSKVEGVDEKASTVKVMAASDKLFELWGPLLSRFAETTSEKVEVLQFLQKILLDESALESYYRCFQVALYQNEVIDQQTVAAWVTHPGSKDGEDMTRLWKAAEGFVEWAMEPDSSEEEDDGSSEEESDGSSEEESD
ncbi:Translation initiation factor 2B, epsilon subunit (eIF-2Bepsilon/GCD6) [Phaffia rhodozyma]|uniref:Translation initiation factor eIF2B subunit epsilon n=1 Tax=Phaffia rhodozyma TaxID=264483 RepID=A0A0F7SM96_PHARH|nr:Translation initiation factor 2B, epsilon subunit (eIF-2Bepsilon/GCD6) [Phaffia rhodozyma]